MSPHDAWAKAGRKPLLAYSLIRMRHIALRRISFVCQRTDWAWPPGQSKVFIMLAIFCYGITHRIFVNPQVFFS